MYIIEMSLKEYNDDTPEHEVKRVISKVYVRYKTLARASLWFDRAHKGGWESKNDWVWAGKLNKKLREERREERRKKREENRK